MDALRGIPPSILVEPVLIEPMTPADWPAVRRIYAEGIATGQATFETEAPGWDAWNRSHLPCMPPGGPRRRQWQRQR